MKMLIPKLHGCSLALQGLGEVLSAWLRWWGGDVGKGWGERVGTESARETPPSICWRRRAAQKAARARHLTQQSFLEICTSLAFGAEVGVR